MNNMKNGNHDINKIIAWKRNILKLHKQKYETNGQENIKGFNYRKKETQFR